MVFLHQQIASRKRPPVSSSVAPRNSKSQSKAVQNDPTENVAAENSKSQNKAVRRDPTEKMLVILAEAGCTLMNLTGPPCLPSDIHALRRHLARIFTPCSVGSTGLDDADSLRSDFISGFSSYIQSPNDLRRILSSSTCNGNDSLARNLLLVPPIQLDIQNMLLEKLPEYFDYVPETSLENDVARLIINHFRWLDFVVSPEAFTDMLMKVVSICPLHLKKEIIGSLPEIIGDYNSKVVIDSLEQMLQEDSGIIVPVLDAFSNLNMDDQLQEQVITIALSCIRTIDAEHMPYLLRFLLLAATPVNVRRIISQIREHLKFIGMPKSAALHSKLKEKLPRENTEACILHALRSTLQFKNILCQEILKELNWLEKPQDHKVIDIWLLMLMHMNGEPIRKSIEKIFKKKIIGGLIQESMLDQCVRGYKELVQDYFPSFLSLAEYLLACKEEKARTFGSYLYSCLFEEFADNYSRQEIIGALVAHVGSDVRFEVSSALEIISHLAAKHTQEMLPFSFHINGILDYLEGFNIENLHKVYEVFSCLALSAQNSSDSLKSSIANEVLMIVRKQVSHSDLKYKRMGLIGTLKIVSSIGDVAYSSPSQESDCGLAMELLKASLDSCKQMSLSLLLFYDELASILSRRKLKPELIDWVGKQVCEFESVFLSDLEGGKLSDKSSCYELEGELWMNLDGDISPICLNIFPLALSSVQSASSLQVLPSNFLLLSTVERLTNNGSLSGIDALLGCPLHLPSAKYFYGAHWHCLTGKQKQILCLSLYYAANWIRELVNAFSSQVTTRSECISQATKEDITIKLLKRLRNLIFLEGLLNNLMKCCPQSLPQLHLCGEPAETSTLTHAAYLGYLRKKNDKRKTCDEASPTHRKRKKLSKDTTNTDGQQPTILDAFRKAGVLTTPKRQNENSSSSPTERASESVDEHCSDTNETVVSEISIVPQAVEAQRFKFRPLLFECFSILIFVKCQDTSISGPTAELPVCLYLLRDLRQKLDYFSATGNKNSSRCFDTPSGFSSSTLNEFFSQVGPLFLGLKVLLNAAVLWLHEGDEKCRQNWRHQSAAAGNPDVPNVMLSEATVSKLIFKEILNCFSKILTFHNIQADAVSNLLQAFQPAKMPDVNFAGQPAPETGSIEYLLLGTCYFLEDILDKACSFSFMLASECLHTLQSVVITAQRYLANVVEGNHKTVNSDNKFLLATLQQILGTSAKKLLTHDWSDESLETGWKNKGESVQKILRIYLDSSQSSSDLLQELACSLLPESNLSKSADDDDQLGFPSLCAATFGGWYRVLHEVNLAMLNKLVKAVCSGNQHAFLQPNVIKTHLTDIQKTVNVVVSLVNMCRTHDKVSVHAMAVKYGGKYVDSFLKVFDFLQAHFQGHSESIIQLVKELQKATRTLQTLCSEAKGSKQTVITSKIPATKRSLERFLFCVKALLHATSSSCAFWMGNLKHKDLAGQVVSSQAYADVRSDDPDEAGDIDDQNQPVDCSSEDRETE